MGNVFEIKDLNLALKEDGMTYPAVDHFSITLKKGKTLGIIGESGSGKSISCMAALGLLSKEKWDCTGRVILNGEELPFLDDEKMRKYRGRSLALIMQNPSAAFNSLYTVRRHFEETIREHDRGVGKAEIRNRALDILEQMHIKDPERIYGGYPFQCSGGILQRIMIGLAVVQNPDVLIADEPTTALDLTTQHEIIKILKEMQARYGTAIIMVSHDLSVIAELADDLAVMYSGNIVEAGDARRIIEDPQHCYTKGLFLSRPAFSKERLPELKGRRWH